MKQINQKLVMFGAMACLGFSLLTVGCDREVSKTESTTVSNDGTVKKQEKTVTEGADGTVTKTEKKQTTNPDKP